MSHVTSKTLMFLHADDIVSLYTDDHDDIIVCTNNMQKDLTDIAKWCHCNKLSLNIKKTTFMLFRSL